MDLLVKTKTPSVLDLTLQSLGGLVMMSGPDTYEIDPDSGAYVVRSLSGNTSFLKFAITNQGYGEVVGETDKYQPGGDDGK